MADTEKKLYTCSACGYDTHHMTNMKKHLQRITTCVPRTHPFYVQMYELYCKEKDQKGPCLKCKLCDKEFKHKSSLSRHKQTCKGFSKDTVSYLQKKVEELEERELSKQVINNVQINNNVIVINSYGSEDISLLLKNSFLDTWVKRRDKGLVEFIIEVLKKPENQNIRAVPNLQNWYDILDGVSWTRKPRDDITQELCNKYGSILCHHWENNNERLIKKFNLSENWENDISKFFRGVKKKDVMIAHLIKERVYDFIKELAHPTTVLATLTTR